MKAFRWVLALVFFVLSSLAVAAFPDKPVKIIIGFPAGGPLDAHARVLADQAAKVLGQPVVIDNRAGAGGVVGLDAAVAALQSGQIDAIVVDTPTGQYMAGYQIVDKKNKPLAVQVGQFPAVGEHYGLLFQKGNALVGCVGQALDTLKANGTLKALNKKWLGIYNEVPKIKP